jgi:hypothetical protein
LSAGPEHADVRVLDQDEDAVPAWWRPGPMWWAWLMCPQGESAIGVDVVVPHLEVAVDEREAAGGSLGSGGVRAASTASRFSAARYPPSSARPGREFSGEEGRGPEIRGRDRARPSSRPPKPRRVLLVLLAAE